MANDEKLADRVRELMPDDAAVEEKWIFGGLAFLVGGNWAVSASGQGGLMVRMDPSQSADLVASTNARPMEMRGRPMQGWLRVDTDDLRTMRQLATWVNMGVAYAGSLSAKP